MSATSTPTKTLRARRPRGCRWRPAALLQCFERMRLGYAQRRQCAEQNRRHKTQSNRKQKYVKVQTRVLKPRPLQRRAKHDCVDHP